MYNQSRLLSGKVVTSKSATVLPSRYQFLNLSSSEPNLGTANADGYVLTFSSLDPGNRKWIPQGEIAGSVGESAYAEANTASANTLYLSGVDLWQNTQLTAVSTLVQAAFNKANTSTKATASLTQPTGNNVGDLWLSLSDETVYIYSYDGISNNWIDISGPILVSSNIVTTYKITSNVL